MITQAPSSQTPVFRINKRDQLSALLTLIVALIAILVGLMWRNVVESRTRSYTDPSGFSFQYPEQWRLDTTAADAGLIRVREPVGADYPATFEVRWLPVVPDATDQDALATALNTLALNRGRELSAYKLLDTQTDQLVKGLPGATAAFVFVDDPTGVFQQGIPAVVLGDDLLARKGDRVYVFSLLAARTNREQTEGLFRAFIESVRLP
ncbi:MAG: hypothetical protein RMN25_00530 [Anaerolineae bacterium]|nr:hypothetical protein [Thermoflexales bacterium]MDW8406240.1 hypothetical protein [Anaerolineae bacterium]